VAHVVESLLSKREREKERERERERWFCIVPEIKFWPHMEAGTEDN
jgi:hypothetical protein